MEETRERGRRLQEEWEERWEAYRSEHPELARRLSAARQGELPEGWDRDLPRFRPGDGPLATRKASGETLDALAPEIPWLIGGSADLTGSNKTHMEVSGILEEGEYGHRNLRWGVREHGMCGASSGMALHGGVRPFAATFFVFTDYARPSIRLAAMMELPVIYVLTHDSIGLGEDGPTHQPVEHLASFRAMPGMCVLRPADANETVEAWRAALRRREGPTMLVLTRQGLPVLDRGGDPGLGEAEGLHRGAYVLARESGDAPPDLLLMGTGSEVQHLLGARETLEAEGHRVRVVSMPSWELFREQPRAYREEVLPPATRARLSLEAASTLGWREWVGPDGTTVGLDRFGASAPAEENFRRLGFTPEDVARRARDLLGSA
jgi:transketolase